MTGTVQILLSTWNGATWIKALLDSLAGQHFRDWELLVRDDGSSDQTLRCLQDWQQHHPQHAMTILPDRQPLGSNRSFSQLVAASTAPYLMFCDQDDVWFPDKITIQLQQLQQLETRYGSQTPLLVHSDLVPTDSELQPLAASFWASRRFRLQQSRKDWLLTNPVSGCASLFNRAAAQQAFPLPEGAMQHDRWLALVCAWFGRIGTITTPLLYYRQHAANQIGAHAAGWRQLGNIPVRIDAWSRQAQALLERFEPVLSLADRRLLQALASVRGLRGGEKRLVMLKHGLLKPGPGASLALLLFA